MFDTRYIFVAVYLIVDIIYVSLSVPAYQKVIKSIQGKPTHQPFGMLAGIAAYTIMGIAWLFFIPPTISHLQKSMRMSRPLAGALAGFVMGLAIYGVFNFTNHAMFDNWASTIMIRDLLWGISWLTVVSTAYAYFST